jgi:hypothetical protein
MVASVYIHGTIGIMGVQSICFVAMFTSLSSLLFALHSEFRSFAKDWLSAFYGGGKLEKLGL